MAAPSGIPFGNYQLLKRIARGGMAEVFLGRQRGPEGFDRLVAVKRVLPHLVDSSNFVRMFFDEARLAANLSHPNCVHIYEFGKVEDHHFIAMEYVEGVNAGELVKQAAREPMPPVLVARIGADACAGLHHAHELRDVNGRSLRLVHRDVSPPNLLVSFDGTVKLVDFGIAKAVTSVEQTRPGVVKGKYAYMSPEQTTGRPLDGKSDVFSLSLVLWELLAGRVAVTREDQVAAMRSIRDGKLTSIEEVRPDVPPQLSAALSSGLEVKPARRANALDLGLALEAYIKSSEEVGSSLHLAQWVRSRFPRTSPTGELESLEEPPGTRQATSATRGTAGQTPSRPLPPDSSDRHAGVDSPSVVVSASVAELEDAETRIRRDPSEPRDEILATFSSPEMPLPAPDDEERSTVAGPAAVRAESIPGAPTPAPLGTSPGEASFTQLAASIPPTRSLRGGGRLRRITFAALASLAIGGIVLLAASAPDSARSDQATAAAEPEAGETPGAADQELEPAAPPGERDRPAGSDRDDRDDRDNRGWRDDRDGRDDRDDRDGRDDGDDPDPADPDPSGGETGDPKKRAPARDLAIIEVITRPPGARVTLDEGIPNESPVLFAEVSPGAHEVLIELDRHEPVRREIRVAAGERRTLELRLEARPPPEPVAAEKKPEEERTRVRRPDRDRPGLLKIRTRPYSEVYHRGKKIGTTPFANVKLKPGRYLLTFENPDYPTQRRRVTIRPGRETKLDFALTR